MNLRKHCPTLATLGNAAAGVAACGFAVSGDPVLAALMILAAVLMDALDGVLARSFGATSEFGAELDSLADVISFGVAPAVVVGSLIPEGFGHIGWAMAVGYVLCAVWRLGRFNAERKGEGGQHMEFAGLPSTGSGAAAATAVLLHVRLSGLFQAHMLLPCVLVLLGALMVSRIPYRHVGVILSRVNPAVAVVTAALFVAGSVYWEYEYLFAALMWTYTLSGPLAVAREKIRAVRHA